MLLSMSETTTYRWSFEKDVAAYAAAGIPAIGVWRQKLSDFGVAKAADLLAQYQLKVSHLFWAGGFTGSDGRTFRESLDDTVEAVRAAAELNAPCLTICTGARAGHTFNHARRLVKEALIELAPVAADWGVSLALEPMHPGCAAHCTFLTNLDDTLALLNAVAHPQVKLVFDTYHLGQDPAVIARIPEIVSRIAMIHLGDARQPPSGEQNRCHLGAGSIPLKEIIQALWNAGYHGYYDVELLGEEVETCDYRSLLEHAKEAFAQLLAERAG